MNPSGSSLFSFSPFDKKNEEQYQLYIEKRAHPLVAFIYWLGGLLPLLFLLNDYFNNISVFYQLLPIRTIYLLFWMSITFLTISRWALFSLKTSLLIYISIGMLYISYLHMIVLERHIQFVPSALFFLFGIIMCQLGQRVALIASLISIGIPTLMLSFFAHFGEAEINVLAMLCTWAVVIWLASIILEKINRKLFSYEIEIKKTNQIKQELLEKEAQANRFKSEFLANMSHEIRTPLTAIMGYSESYFDDGQSRETRDSSVKTIYHNGEYLLTLVNDILDLSKIEAGKLTLEEAPCELFALLEQINKMQLVLAGNKGLSFNIHYHFPLPQWIITDSVRLKQILINLSSNAIKFTETGQIDLDINYQQNQIHFKISDTGIGMDQQACSKLFSAYHQTSKRHTRLYGGTGLGLYISKQLIEKLGGNIDVKSQLNKGSSFSFFIQAKQKHETHLLDFFPTPNEQEVKTTKAAFSGRVLLADDHDDNRRYINHKLTKLGFIVDQVQDGQQAINKNAENRYVLIFMDIEMPVKNGEQAAKEIKSQLSPPPIIALTANSMKHEISKYLHTYFDAHIAKPIQHEQFIATIRTYFKNQSTSTTGSTAIMFDDDDALFSLNSEAYKRLVADYVASLPCEIEMLKHAKSARNWEKLAKVAHGLKGSAGNFGFPEVTNKAGHLEDLIRNNKINEVDQAFDELYKVLHCALYKNE